MTDSLHNTTSLGANPAFLHTDPMTDTSADVFNFDGAVLDPPPPPPPPVVLKGDNYANVLEGVDSSHNLIIHGYGGDDILAGGHAEDTLIGGAGNDTLFMGNRDLGIGGSGTNDFVFFLDDSKNDYDMVRAHAGDVMTLVSRDAGSLHITIDHHVATVTDDQGHTLTIDGVDNLDQFFETKVPPPASPDFHLG